MTTVASLNPALLLDQTARLSPVLASLGRGMGGDLSGTLLQGLADSEVGVCLCDAADTIRFANHAFKATCLQSLREEPTNFVEALAAEIRLGRGIALNRVPLEDFIPRAKERRKNLQGCYTFAADFNDGTWWLINEHKLDNGWILVMATDISSLKTQEFQLREDHAAALKDSQTDHLTGLANRRHGLERAEAALEAHRRDRLPLSVALIDIDYFKRINDLYGHETGDRVLVHFAQQLVAGTGARDQVSRIGGEEFLLVMPETPSAKARTKLGPFTHGIPPLAAGLQRSPLQFTASAGLAQAHHAESLTDLLHRADVALYEAKAKGRHRTELCPRRHVRARDPRPATTRSTPATAGLETMDR